MDVFIKTLPKRIRTKKDGVYYKEIEKTVIDDKGNVKTSIVDKVYLIRYYINKKEKWITIGKYSAGIREEYCKAKRNEILHKIRLGEEPPEIVRRKRKKAAVTLNEIFDFYINGKKMSPRTKKDFEGRYNKHIKPLIGDRPAGELTAEDIIAARSKVEGSVKTKEMTVQILSAAYNFYIVHSEAKITNPIDRLRALDRATMNREAKKSKRSKREGYLKKEEVQQLRKALEGDLLSTLAIEILLSTGVRISGALTIKKRDVDLDAGTIQLIDHKAGGETYTGFISDPLRDILEDHLPKLGRNDYVLSRDGSPTPYKNVMRPIKKEMDRLFNEGLETDDSKNRIVLHSLRHTFASHLALQNVPLYTIKELMHHADISMTLRYAKLSQENGAEAVRRLGL